MLFRAGAPGAITYPFPLHADAAGTLPPVASTPTSTAGSPDRTTPINTRNYTKQKHKLMLKFGSKLREN